MTVLVLSDSLSCVCVCVCVVCVCVCGVCVCVCVRVRACVVEIHEYKQITKRFSNIPTSILVLWAQVHGGVSYVLQAVKVQGFFLSPIVQRDIMATQQTLDFPYFLFSITSSS